MADQQRTSLPLVKRSDLEVLKIDPKQLRDLFAVNVPGPVSQFMLERIKIASGSALQWLIPDGANFNGVKAFDSVIVSVKRCRAYWDPKLKGKNPPACKSEDCMTGLGKRFPDDPQGQHSCLDCPLAAWGSEVKKDGRPGRGQACGQRYLNFVLQEQTVVPSIVSLPPTSMKALDEYMLNQLTKVHRLRYYDVVTRFGLTKATNADGQDYGVASLSVAKVLDPEARAALAEILKALLSVVESHRVATEDFSDVTNTTEAPASAP